MARFPISPVLVALAVSQLGASDCGAPPVIRDDGFDLWCGDRLCVWHVIRGDARRVGTWHDHDSGVELVGDDAAIEQVSPITSSNTSCVRFEMIANVAETAEAYLEVDVYADGAVDRMERLPTANWEPVSYLLSFKAPFDGVRFVLSKRGTGTAVLAQIRARREDAGLCAGLTQIGGGLAPLGGHCTFDADCASQLCGNGGAFNGGICLGCNVDRPCPTNQVCGRGDALSPQLAVPYTCVPKAGDELGELCAIDDECRSGHCAKGLCSTCSASSQCTGTEVCGEAWPGGPSVCAPAGHARKPGEPCATQDDCASNACNGAMRGECDGDGFLLPHRPCTVDAECPLDNNLEPYPCLIVGIQGGTCQ